MKEETPESTEWKRVKIAEQFPKLFVIYKGCNDPFGYYRKDAAGYTTIEHAWQVSEEVGLKEVCGRDTDPDRVRLKPAPIPNYFRDQNAIISAAASLDVDKWSLYQATLDDICFRDALRDAIADDDPGNPHSFAATAAQRAEAFGLTLGLWKPGQTEI